MDHQHLSNIYWFNRIINEITSPKIIMDRITNDFDGSILPYRPKPSFKLEIDELDKRGLLSWR